MKQAPPEWTRFGELLRAYGPAVDLVGPGLDLAEQWTIAEAVGEFAPAGSRVGDLGAGAGLPGIPLALQRPDLRVLLVERRQRRATFLRRAVGELGLGNVEVFAGGAEAYRGEPVDVLVAQKVGSLDVIWRAGRRLVGASGRIVTVRGAGYDQEVEELKRADGEAWRLVGERAVGDARVIALEWRREWAG